ncbi:MAG: hypothetical protein U0T74_11465 [Chitinophagales bacterium]
MRVISSQVLLTVCFFSFILFTSFGGEKPVDVYPLYYAAVKNKSQFQYFVVIRQVDAISGTERELCTQGAFLRSALHKEIKLHFDIQEMMVVEQKLLDNDARLFEFKNPDALQILGIDNYTPAEMALLEKEVSFKTLAAEIKKGTNWKMEFADDKRMLMYAHALFNRGVLTGEYNDSLGVLHYVKLQ